MDELMIALTNQHDAIAEMLTNSHQKQERPTPIDLSVSSSRGGMQMTIDVGKEKGETIDIRKFKSSLLEMAFAPT